MKCSKKLDDVEPISLIRGALLNNVLPVALEHVVAALNVASERRIVMLPLPLCLSVKTFARLHFFPFQLIQMVNDLFDWFKLLLSFDEILHVSVCLFVNDLNIVCLIAHFLRNHRCLFPTNRLLLLFLLSLRRTLTLGLLDSLALNAVFFFLFLLFVFDGGGWFLNLITAWWDCRFTFLLGFCCDLGWS